MQFKNVTITTDISVSPDFKYASYAFWISTERGHIKKSGLIKKASVNTTLMEIKCITNATWYLFNKTNIRPETLIINTDSLGVVEIMSRKLKPFSLKPIRVIARELKTILDLNKQQYKFKHVKAHVKVSSARSYVNNWCDKEAKRVIKEFLKAKSNEQKQN